MATSNEANSSTTRGDYKVNPPLNKRNTLSNSNSIEFETIDEAPAENMFVSANGSRETLNEETIPDVASTDDDFGNTNKPVSKKTSSQYGLKLSSNAVKPGVSKRTVGKRSNNLAKNNKEMTIETAQKRTFYLTKTALMGYVAENIRDTRFVNPSNNNKKAQAIVPANKPPVKSDLYNTDYNKLDLNNQYQSSSRYDPPDEKNRVLKVSGFYRSESPPKKLTARNKEPDASQSASSADSRSPIFRRDTRPYKQKRTENDISAKNSIDTNRSTASNKNLLVSSRVAPRTVVGTKLIDVETVETVDETPAPASTPRKPIKIARKDDATPVVKKKVSKQSENITEIKHKDYEFDIIDERKTKIQNTKRKETTQVENVEESSRCCCECKGTKKSDRFCCCLFIVVTTFILITIAAVVIASLYYK